MSTLTAPIATKDLAAAVADWAVTAAPALEEAYNYPPADRGPLPDIAVLVTDANVVASDSRWKGTGHNLLRVYAIELLIVVDPDPITTATDLLTDIADALTVSVLNDRTLGDVLPAPGASPLVTFTSAPDPAEVQFEDGTLGRVGKLGLAVGEWLPQAR